jgi:hypothetical protein
VGRGSQGVQEREAAVFRSSLIAIRLQPAGPRSNAAIVEFEDFGLKATTEERISKARALREARLALAQPVRQLGPN